jgi:hypothetical protein
MIESHSWFYESILILNTVKTISLPFHTRQGRDLMEHQLQFGSMDIACKSETKFLSVHISEYMKWDA